MSYKNSTINIYLYDSYCYSYITKYMIWKLKKKKKIPFKNQFYPTIFNNNLI